MRLVFDTNLLISAVLFANGQPGRALRHGLRHGEILTSLTLLAELDRVLRRKKFDRYVTIDERQEFLQALILRSLVVEPVEKIQVCRDPTDDKFLEVAVAGNASYLVTGDADLLTLNPFREIAIVTARQFLSLTPRGQSSEET